MKKTLSSLKSIFIKEKESAIVYPHKLEIIGGKLVCLDLIPTGSTIISGGIGNDVYFELKLIERKNVQVIGIDPTGTADQFIKDQRIYKPLLKSNFIYLKKALSDSNTPIKLFYGNDDGMSSISSEHRDADKGNYFVCESVTIEELLKQYSNVSYLKLDIEGAEYGILDKLQEISIPQISIEFHHHCSTEYTLSRTTTLIEKLISMGYDAIDYGSYCARERKLPMFAAKWSDLNCELLFIKR